jgi:lactoylglutathione lyase
MRLAKQHLDIGLFTNEIAAHDQFWGETVGLRLDHKLPIGRGIVQHRYDAHDSVIKVNNCANPLKKQGSSGYAGLTIARAGAPAWEGRHPGGEMVRLVPPGTDGVLGIGITVRTPDVARMMEFYVRGMEFEKVGPSTVRCGDTLLFVEKGPAPDNDPDDFVGVNFRYLTIQIFNCDEACKQIAARGGRISKPPTTLGTVARYAFVCDPDGNWFEISERGSLTGVTPPMER